MATSKKFILPIEFHPGVTLSEKLKELGMSVKEFAVRTSKPEKTIFAVISGKSSVTSDMAVAFESVTKIPAHFWLNMQRGYDEYVARQKREEQLASACAWANSFPLSQMVKYGWLPKMKTAEEKVKVLLSFFQFSTEKAWEDYYLNQQLKVAFRISLNNIKEPHSISAWLREGEIKAARMDVAAFSENGLREAIPAMKKLCARQPVDFAMELQSLCAKVGVKLIYVPSLPNAPINGSTRWLNDIPCIQMTGRHKRNDIFWFTFFHELGHILLHGKRDIFLEDVEYADKQKDKEDEADAFASRVLLPQAAESEIIKKGDYSADSIKRFAEEFGVHPGIIVGRLQHKKVIPFTSHSNLFVKVDLFN